jgi:hypothetical protein
MNTDLEDGPQIVGELDGTGKGRPDVFKSLPSLRVVR